MSDNLVDVEARRIMDENENRLVKVKFKYLDCNFYLLLKNGKTGEQEHQNVANFRTRRQNDNIFESDVVIISICYNGHWSLEVVLRPNLLVRAVVVCFCLLNVY